MKTRKIITLIILNGVHTAKIDIMHLQLDYVSKARILLVQN